MYRNFLVFEYNLPIISFFHQYHKKIVEIGILDIKQLFEYFKK